MTLPDALALVAAYRASPPAPGPLSEATRRENLLLTLWEGLPRSLWPHLLARLGAGRHAGPGRTKCGSATEAPPAALRRWLAAKRSLVPGVPAPHQPRSGPVEYRVGLGPHPGRRTA